MSIDPESTYYDAGGIETISIIKAKLTEEQYEGYLLGNIIKYATRMNFKPGGSKLRDMQKLTNYANQLADSKVTIGLKERNKHFSSSVTFSTPDDAGII